MKTTIHIPDNLFNEARKVARAEKTTLKALVEEGLRKAISERRGRNSRKFILPRASFKGRGLRPELAGMTWARVLDTSYEGRGG